MYIFNKAKFQIVEHARSDGHPVINKDQFDRQDLVRYIEYLENRLSAVENKLDHINDGNRRLGPPINPHNYEGSGHFE